MSKKPPKPHSVSARSNAEDNTSTVIWGEELEAGNFIKLPRTVLRLGRYGDESAKRLQPRHILLLLALAGRKFKTKPIRAYWQDLAEDLGVKVNTIRKWAYEVRDFRFLTIRQHRGRDPETNRPGIRNERNSFSLEPFVQALRAAHKRRQQERAKRGGGTEDE